MGIITSKLDTALEIEKTANSYAGTHAGRLAEAKWFRM
jgi:hypothetical protein